MIGFAAAAVLIAAIGLYGVISYGVTQRVREFGIRRALGAETGALISLVIGQGARLAGLGAALGLIGALWPRPTSPRVGRASPTRCSRSAKSDREPGQGRR